MAYGIGSLGEGIVTLAGVLLVNPADVGGRIKGAVRPRPG